MMKKMGIEAAVRAATVHESGMQLIDLNGRTKAFFPAVQNGTGNQSFTSEYEIMRGDLVSILYRLTENRQNVRHLFNTTIDSFTQDEESDPNGKVHVRFQDGHNEDFDLVVGADGSGSKTRRMMLGPDAPDPRHRLGGFIGYFSIPSKLGDSDRGTLCHLPGRKVSRIIATRKDCPDLTRVYMLMHGPADALDAAYKSGDLAELKKSWADLYQDGGWESGRFMEALRHAREADDLYCTPFEEVNLPVGSWSKGRVVLLGDSAYGQTAGGFGCAWGLVGAYILAGEIATLYSKDRPSPTAAAIQGAQNYEKRFRPIATTMHGARDRFGSLFFPRSSFGIRLLHLFAGVAAHFKLEQWLGLDDKISKWQLPEYPALERE
jgi:2-polyprenyl-6-methoxyphenol hydroxylase-like FAD-dependent oxidoreductase